tara:strand:+ start:73 stop:921 length:849 start_codon:yes stop_codon:yes gene_type:complete
MSGSPTAPGSGSDYAIRYQAELPEVMSRKLGLMDKAVDIAKGNFGTYQPQIPKQQVAPFSNQQLQAQNLVSQGIGGYQQYVNQAKTLAGKATDPTAYQDFLNPYQSYVTQGIEDQFAKAQNQAAAQAVQTGAFGTEREGLQKAELQGQQAETVGQSLAQGYGQAQQMAQQAYGQGAQQQMALGQGAQQMAMGDISNLMQSGGQQQQLLQQGYDVDYRQKLQQMYEPYQRLGFVSDIFQGAPTSASSLAMATTPQANPLAQAVGAGISGLAAYQGYKGLTGQN